MSDIGVLSIGVEIDMAELNRELDRVGASARSAGNDIDRSLSSAGAGADRTAGRMGGVRTAALGIGSAMAGVQIAQVFAAGIGEAEEAQATMRQVEAAISSTGGAANVSGDDVSDLSTRLEKLAAVDGDIISQSQAVLLTFTKVRNEVGANNNVFDQATEAALNMSSALGTDLQSATVMVGKALNDPIAGITAMTRAGVQFTEQQKAQIAALAESGDQLGAQKIILGELTTQFGGAAEANKTGSMEMSVAWGNLQEQIGTALLPALGVLAEVLGKVTEIFSALPAPVRGGVVVLGLLFAAGAMLAPMFLAASAAGVTLGGVFAFITSPIWLVVAAVAAVIAIGVLLAQNWDSISGAASAAWGAITGTIGAAVGWIGGHIDTLGRILLGFATGGLSEVARLIIGHWDSISAGAAAAWGAVVDTISGAVDWIVSVPGTVTDALSGLWTGLGAGLRSAWNGVARLINGIELTFGGYDLPGPGPNIPGFAIGLPNLPILDQGGIVSRPTLGLLAANSRPEVVIPLDRMGGMGGGPSVTVNANALLGTERDVIRWVRRGLDELAYGEGG